MVMFKALALLAAAAVGVRSQEKPECTDTNFVDLVKCLHEREAIKAGLRLVADVAVRALSQPDLAAAILNLDLSGLSSNLTAVAELVQQAPEGTRCGFWCGLSACASDLQQVCTNQDFSTFVLGGQLIVGSCDCSKAHVSEPLVWAGGVEGQVCSFEDLIYGGEQLLECTVDRLAPELDLYWEEVANLTMNLGSQVGLESSGLDGQSGQDDPQTAGEDRSEQQSMRANEFLDTIKSERGASAEEAYCKLVLNSNECNVVFKCTVPNQFPVPTNGSALFVDNPGHTAEEMVTECQARGFVASPDPTTREPTSAAHALRAAFSGFAALAAQCARQ